MTDPADHDASAPSTTHELHRRVLDQLPTPIVVVDALGTIVYGNTLLGAMFGVSEEDGLGRNLAEFIHPDDIGWVMDAFGALSAAGPDDSDWASEPWAPVPMRLVDARGRVIQVEVTGANCLHDEVVGGFVYEVRHGAEPLLLRQVLTGLASGRPIDELAQLVAEMIAAPPVRLEVIVAEVRDGHCRVVGAAGPNVADAFDRLDLDAAPWVSATDRPEQLQVTELAEPYRTVLTEAGFADWCHVSVPDNDGGTAYRVVALPPYHHVPATGILHRLARATELLGIIRIRAINDALLAHRARHDSLTELPNRAGLADALAGRTPPTAVLFVDLDGFKPVNDRYGHATGDHVLRAVAQRIQRAVRPSDVVARVGGDEFVVVLPGAAGSDDPDASADAGVLVDAIADRIVRELTRPIEVNGVEIRISASIGVAVAPGDTDVDTLVASADAAMYEVKRSGGSGHRVAGP